MARIRPRTQVKSGPSSVAGSGTSPIIAAGTPDASAAEVEGSGVRVLTGSGVPAASSASVVGTAYLSENAPRIDNLISSYSVPSGLECDYPADPTGTLTEVTISNGSATDFETAYNAGSRRITVTADIVGDVTLTGDDVDVIFSPSTVSLTGDIAWNGSARMRWTGGRHIGGSFSITGCADLLWDNWYSECSGTQVVNNILGNGQARFFWINCTLNYNEPSSGGGWALHSNTSDGGSTQYTYADFALINCKLYGIGEQLLRLVNVDPLWLVDVWIGPAASLPSSSPETLNPFRLQGDTTGDGVRVWAKNILSVGSDVNQFGGTDGGVTGVFEGFEKYGSNRNLPANPAANTNGSGPVTNSVMHSNNNSPPTTPLYSPYTDGSGNSLVAWSDTMNEVPGATLWRNYVLGKSGECGATRANTNLVQSSRDLGSAPWGTVAGGATVSTGATGPDGVTASTRLTRVDSPDDGRQQGITTALSTVYTVSGFMRNVSSVESDLFIFDGIGTTAVAQLEILWSGDTPSVGGSANASNITMQRCHSDSTDPAYEWWRINYTFTSHASNTTSRVTVKPSASSGSNGQAIDYLDFQLELGDTLTYFKEAA